MPPAMKRKVHTRTKIAEDLEVHASTIRSAGQTFFELRQYIPSLKQYGRGVTVPGDATTVTHVIEGAQAHRREDHFR